MISYLLLQLQIQLMGTCGSQQKKTTNKAKDNFDQIPQDTKLFKNLSLPTLSFSILLSDIKIKKCQHKFLSFKFKIDKVHEYFVPTNQIDSHQKSYWKVRHIFDFFMTQYQLRNKFLEIQAYGYQKQLLGTLKINLYILWIGPYHLNFNLPLKMSDNTRLSFNFKISQGVIVKIQNLQTQMIIQDPHIDLLESQFTYSISTMIGQQIQSSACPYMVHVKANEKQCIDNLKTNHTIQTQYVAKNAIIWQQKKAKYLFLPKFEKRIAFYEIYSSSLHLTFFRVVKNREQAQQLKYEILSQCYISFSKFLQLQYFKSIDPVTKITFLGKELDLVEKIWSQGKQVGKVKVKFNFNIQQYQKQMQTCVRTQDGILPSSPVFIQPNSNKKTQQCEQITKLKKLSNSIQNQFMKLDTNMRKKTQNNYNAINQIILRINDQLASLLTILQVTYKQSILFYQYKNQLELYEAQRYLMDLAFKILSFLHQNIDSTKSITWSALTTILKRGQFQLQHIGFDNQQKENIEKQNINSQLQIKIDVCLKYQELLNHLLTETLILLQIQGQEAQKTFAQSFCAYAYFRIPLFRQNIMLAIKKKNDPQIPQWRGTQTKLYQQQNSERNLSKNDTFYSNLFDWENSFYKPISQQEKSKSQNIKLQEILLTNTWKGRIQKRGGAFYTFFENLIIEIERVCVVSKYIKWYSLPGYNRLLHAFLSEMKSEQIKNYSQRFKTCCIQLLSNQKLLNVFVAILLKKTNVHQSQTISKTFLFLESYFTRIKKNDRPIPRTFDYKFLLEGLRLILSSQHVVNITKALLFIYHHFNTFSSQFILELSLFLLSKYFFKFFFHWSYNIRYSYHYLLLSKIRRIGVNKQINAINDKDYTSDLGQAIKQRYNYLMKIVDKQIKSKMYENNQNTFYEKKLYKKMSINLQEKKRLKKKYNNSEQIIPVIIESEQLVLPSIRSIKSSQNLQRKNSNKSQIIPNKLIYFKDSDMELITYKDENLHYITRGLSQYKTNQQQLNKNISINKNYDHPLQIKQLLDQRQISPMNHDQW